MIKVKNLVTTLVVSIFVILAMTGIFLFVDIDSDMLEDIHAYLGISFIVLGLLHLFNNFSILKNYLKKNKPLVYMMSSLLILGVVFVSFALVFGEDDDDHNHNGDKSRYESKDEKYKSAGRSKSLIIDGNGVKRGHDDDDDHHDKRKR